RSLVLFSRLPGTHADPWHLSFPLTGTRLIHRHSRHPSTHPSPAPLRSPTPRATPGALCLCTVNSRKVDSPSRLSPRGQRNLTPWGYADVVIAGAEVNLGVDFGAVDASTRSPMRGSGYWFFLVTLLRLR
ncbi:hypothetical protein C0993_008575, partial [Termitomyces sp. T159_Od127]